MSMIMSTLAMTENSERRCLVIIDELGRGTSPVEGVGIAHALAEEVIKSKVRFFVYCTRGETDFGEQSVCFFATHFKVRLATPLSSWF